MRVCIAGSRSIREMSLLEAAIERSGFEITEVLTGDAGGVDQNAVTWAKLNNVPYKVYVAEWWNMGLPWVRQSARKGRVYNKAAGMWRSKVMIKDADALILLWDGESSGSKATLEFAREKGIPCYVFRPNPETGGGVGMVYNHNVTGKEAR